jgi:hypothetical protein
MMILNNSQDVQTPVPFQQNITIDPANYTEYESPDLGNIRFYLYLEGGVFQNPINSWLEPVSGYPANVVTGATFWLKLPVSIPADSTLAIYMVFLPTTIDFDGIIAGEAPQSNSPVCSCDNGGNVFLYYNSGNSNSDLSLVNPGSDFVSSMMNPYGVISPILDLEGPGNVTTSSEVVAWIDSPFTGTNITVEGWVNTPLGGNGFFALEGQGDNYSTGNYLLGTNNSKVAMFWINDSALVQENQAPINISSGWLWDEASIDLNAQTIAVYSSDPFSNASVIIPISTISYGNQVQPLEIQYVGIAVFSGSNLAAAFYGLRVRASPPNGMFPSLESVSNVTQT